jgi:hypothetical protein
MTCEELQDHYELFAMGAAGEPERSEIREHLNRDCEVCMAGMKRAREITAILGGTPSGATPSPKLRRRILASVGFEQRSFGWTPFLAAATALSLCAAVYFGGREREFAEMAARLRDQMGRQNIELTRLNEAFAILNGPDTKVVSFGAGQPQPPKGRVFVNPSQGVVLIASNLPPAPSGKVYEMWMVPKGGKPVRAGEFQSQSDGTAMHVHRGPVDVSATGAVAVTMENEGGADQPTMPILAVAALQ